MNIRIKDLTGKVYGKLTVIKFSESKKGRSHWICVCECGNGTEVASNNLRHNKINFCGKCSTLPVSESLARIIFRDYRHRAKYDELDFTVTYEEVKSIISGNCHYCGSEPLNTKTRNGKTFAYNGIDRIDSSAGYTSENVRSCCGTCNTMKLDYTEEEFKEHLKKIYSYWIGK